MVGCFAGRAAALVFLCLVWPADAQSFKCNSAAPTPNTNVTCRALIDYPSPNATTLSTIQSLFNVRDLDSILGANGLPPNTPPTHRVSINQTIKIPFPCLCNNGTGVSNNIPIYTVVPNDGLYHIAAQVFSGLVTFQEIQRVNNIQNADLILVGQKLWIPLPCSCDQVNGERVVHYGHLVASGSTVEGIAQQYGTTPDTLSQLNGLAGPTDLKAGAIIDVPLRACASWVSSNSLDYPLLVSNGTYVFTANNCVNCSCDAAKNWTLQCVPSQMKPSTWASCPSMQCQGNVPLGKTGNGKTGACNGLTCAYAGYSNQTIFTPIALEPTCPASGDTVSIQGSWKQKFGILIFGQLLLFVYNAYLL